MAPSHQPVTLSGLNVHVSRKTKPGPLPAGNIPASETFHDHTTKEIAHTSDEEEEEEEVELQLRGGGLLKRRPSKEKITRAVWFLAGGMGKPPTGRGLKEWKKKDREDLIKKTGKPEVGFWGDFERGLNGANKEKKEKKENKNAEAANASTTNSGAT